MKLQSLLVLGPSDVAMSQFICTVGWLAGFCMVQVFYWVGFWKRF